MSRSYRISEKETMISYLKTPFSTNIVTDDVTIADNSVAFNDTYKALRINDASAANKGALEIPIGFLNIGDRINIEVEVMNVSGVKAKIAIDLFNTIDMTDVSYPNLGIVQSEKTGEFETLCANFISTKNMYGRLAVGVFTGDIGDIYIRNIKVTVSSANEKPKFVERIKSYTLVGSASGFKNDANYSDEKCTVDVTSTQITVTHDKPFPTAAKKGNAFGNICARSEFGKYIAKFRGEAVDKFIIEIYDTTTGNIVDPTTFQNNTTFYIKAMHLGYEYKF
jgi:hypothetical protein